MLLILWGKFFQILRKIIYRVKSENNLNLLKIAAEINHVNIWKFVFFEENQHYIMQNEDYFSVKEFFFVFYCYNLIHVCKNLQLA